MLVYLATIALFIAVIGLSCYQNSMDNKIDKQEKRITSFEEEMRKEVKKINNRIDNITD